MLWKLFCISVCLIRESRISNKMPSSQSHIYPQSFNSCPVRYSLVLRTCSPFLGITINSLEPGLL